jgi:hypothetical protein
MSRFARTLDTGCRDDYGRGMRDNPLANRIGRELRVWREARGLRQDDIARAARQAGLKWTRSVVVALEAERRYLTIDELVRLPLMLELLGAPSGQPEVVLRAHAALAQYEIAPLFPRPVARDIGIVVNVETAPALMHESEETKHAAYRGAGGDLEQKVARRFRLDPLVVALLAHRTWTRTLSEERDRRVAEQAPPDTSPRAMQALRGHVTRALLQELEPRLVEARKRLQRKRAQR